MKTIKYILTAFVLTSFLFACDKNNEIKYTVKGRLMHACGVPAANVTDVSFKQHGQPLFGQKGMFLSFNTDAEGYFEVVYNRKDANSLDMEILKNGPILEGIPAMKNLDLGEVFWGVPPVSFVRKIVVYNQMTVNDTLLLTDYNDPNPLAEIRIPGPFSSGIIDTVWNATNLNNISFNVITKFESRYRLTSSNDLTWKGAVFPITNFCTDELYEAVIKIE